MYSWEPTLTEEKRKDLHETVMKLGQERETGTTHELSEDQLRTVLATADFFTQDGYTDQVKFDLVNARYKIYDWIAMLLDGRDGREREANPGYGLGPTSGATGWLRGFIQ